MWENTLFPPSAASSLIQLLWAEKLWVVGTATGRREGVHREKMTLTSNIALKDLILELQCLSPKPPSSPSGDSKQQQTAPGTEHR